MLNTREAAKRVGVSLITLQRWIASGKVRAPRLTIRDGRAVRLWADADIEALRNVKDQIYCKGRGRKAQKRRR